MIVEVTLKGMPEIQNKIKSLIAAGKDLTPLHKDIGTGAMKLIGKVFANEGLPQWKPRKDELTHPILDKTGRLKRSWRKGEEGNIFNADKTGVEIGSDIQVGSYNLALLHEGGTSRMVARPIFTEFVLNAMKMILFWKTTKFYEKIIKGTKP